jgi:hypothetical protein
MHDLQNTFDLINKVTNPTRNNAILDVILISDCLSAEYEICASIRPPIGTSDHNCVQLNTVKNVSRSSTSTFEIFNYNNTTVYNFVQHLSQIDFNNMYRLNDMDSKCNFFHNTLLKALKTNIPKIKVTLPTKSKPWMSAKIKWLIDQRWAAYRKRSWPEYNKLKIDIRKEIVTAKKRWVKKSNSSKHLWKTVNETKGTSSIPNDMNVIINKFKNIQEAADQINFKLGIFW